MHEEKKYELIKENRILTRLARSLETKINLLVERRDRVEEGKKVIKNLAEQNKHLTKRVADLQTDVNILIEELD